jgi:hypothetical protein
MMVVALTVVEILEQCSNDLMLMRKAYMGHRGCVIPSSACIALQLTMVPIMVCIVSTCRSIGLALDIFYIIVIIYL